MSEYSQPDIDNMLMSRTHSDYSLLKNGAGYENGILRLTQEQKDNIAMNREYSPQQIAVLALYSSDLAIVHTPEIQLKLEAAASKEIAFQIGETVAPYVSLYREIISSLPPRRPLFKRKDQYATSPQYATKITGDLDATYRTTMFYTSDGTSNELNRVKTEISSDGEFRYEENPSVRLFFNQDGLRKIALDDMDDPRVWTPLLSCHGDPTDLLKLLRTRRSTRRFVFDVQSEQPSLVLGDTFDWLSEYRFAPSDDNFRLLGNSSSDRQPGKLSKAEFMKLLTEALAVLPTSTLELKAQ